VNSLPQPSWQPPSGAGPIRVEQARAYALLIAVTGYERGWRRKDPIPWTEASTTDDTTALRRVLIHRFGFDPTRITVLDRPGQTTRANILAALDALTRQVSTGDTVAIHYSGHGDTGPGDEPTWVPSDWFDHRDPFDRNASRHIRASEIGRRITRLRDRLQGGDSTRRANLLLTFDCCHAGNLLSGVRSLQTERIRGRNGGGPRTAKAPTIVGNTEARDGLLPPSVFTGVRGLAGILACRHGERAGWAPPDPADGRDSAGFLTAAIVRALQAADSSTTHADLFQAVQATMARTAPGQHAVLVGDNQTQLFQGRARRDPPHFALRPATNDAQAFVVDAGRLHGMTSRSYFLLHPRGARDTDPARAVGKADIVRLGSAESTVRLVAGTRSAALRGLWAVPVHPIDDRPVRLTLDPPRDAAGGAIPPELANRLRSWLKASSDSALFSIGPRDSAQLELVKVPGGIDLRPTVGAATGVRYPAIDGDGKVVDGPTVPDSESDTERARRLRATVERVARAILLRGLSVRKRPAIGGTGHSLGVAVEIRMVPARVDPMHVPVGSDLRDVRYLGDLPLADGVVRDWNLGEFYTLELRNIGSEDCRVAWFDIDANGWVTGMVKPGGSPQTFRATREPQFPVWEKARPNPDNPIPFLFQVCPPAGQSTLHAIATAESLGDVDLSALASGTAFEAGATDRSLSSRVWSTNLGRQLEGWIRGRTRSVGGGVIDDLDVGIAVVPYWIR